MARQAEAEREKRAKIINAEGESLAAAALGAASDKNTTVVFPAPLMFTIGELGSFLAREQAARTQPDAAGAAACAHRHSARPFPSR